MAGRPRPDATNRSNHMRRPFLCNRLARLGFESCQKIGRKWLGRCLAASHHAKEELNGRAERAARCLLMCMKETTMKVTTITLATAFTLTSTLALAQMKDTDQSCSLQWARMCCPQ